LLSPSRIAEAIHGQAYHWARFTKPQRRFMSCQEPAALWRDANGVGKSIALAILAHDACRGHGRFTNPIKRPPVKVIVCGVSWDQMVPLMEKIWDYAPKDEIDPRNNFEPGRGITGKPPRIVYTSGPGKGSVISFATYKQGSQRIAGAQVALVILDEPPPELFLGEALPRVLRNGGRLRIGFTPTLESPPLDYLWKKIDEDKTISEYNFGLTEEACWLEGAPRPWKTQAELELYEKSLLGPEREMRTGRSRYPLVGDRWITAFEDRHIAEVLPQWPQPDFEWAVGIDYGIAPGKTVAGLVGCFQPFGDPPVVFFHDVYKAEGVSSIEDDAVGILSMLSRNGLRYEDVAKWVGDRKAEARVQGIEKSNQDLRGAMAHLMRRPWDRMRPIKTPKKSLGSPVRGGELINTLFAQNRATVRPHMKPLIDAFRLFNGDKKHDTKDAFDAFSYATQELAKVGSALVAKAGRLRVRG
jgi:phage terminase large subunit-like protein